MMNQEALAYWKLQELNPQERHCTLGGSSEDSHHKRWCIALGVLSIVSLYLISKQFNWPTFFYSKRQHEPFNLVPRPEAPLQKPQPLKMRLGSSKNELPQLRKEIIESRFKKASENPYFNVKVDNENKCIYVKEKPFFVKKTAEECVEVQERPMKDYPRIGASFISAVPLVREEECQKRKDMTSLLWDLHRSLSMVTYLENRMVESWKDYTFVIEHEKNGIKTKEKLSFVINRVIPDKTIHQELRNWVLFELGELAAMTKAPIEETKHGGNTKMHEYLDQQVAKHIYLLGKSFGLTVPKEKLKEWKIQWNNQELGLTMNLSEVGPKNYDNKRKIEKIRRRETGPKNTINLLLLTKQGRNEVATKHQSYLEPNKKFRLGSKNKLAPLQQAYQKAGMKRIEQNPFYNIYVNRTEKKIYMNKEMPLARTEEEWDKFVIISEACFGRLGSGLTMSTLLFNGPVVLETRVNYDLRYSCGEHHTFAFDLASAAEKKLKGYTIVTETNQSTKACLFPNKNCFLVWLWDGLYIDTAVASAMLSTTGQHKVNIKAIYANYIYFANILGIKPSKAMAKKHGFQKGYNVRYADLPKTLADLALNPYKEKQKRVEKIRRHNTKPLEVIDHRLLAKLRRNGEAKKS